MRAYRENKRGTTPLKHGHTGYRFYGCRCEICKAAVNEYQRGYESKRRKRPDVKAKRDAYQAEYRVREREKKIAYSEAYNKLHKERLRAMEATTHGRALRRKSSGKRRALKVSQFVEDVDPRVVYEMHGGMCGICEGFVAEDDFHVDHVIPLSRGGVHGYVNCQPAHPFCNMSKHNSLPVAASASSPGGP